MKPTSPVLSIIIPVRINDNVDIIQRLSWRKYLDTKGIEIVVVDDGSRDCDLIQSLCSENNWVYIRLETQDAPFSASRARNAGIRAATAEFIYFEDVDLIHKTDFYQSLIKISVFLEESPFNFAAVPVLYLTKKSSEALVDLLGKPKKFNSKIDDFITKLPFINTDEPNDLCDVFAPVGSNILVRRSLCFHVGLFDEYFSSWGGEDRDFVFRLLNHNNYLFRPSDFGQTKNWPIHRTNTYEGWRSVYKLHGDWVSKLGLYSMHIHHPDNGWKDPYARQANVAYASKKSLDIAERRRHVNPSPMPNEDLTILVGRNPVFFNEEIMKILGNVTVIDPDYQVEPDVFAEKIRQNTPIQVIFQNPYGTTWMLSVWRILKEEGFKCICAERGALPWSIYFDEGGFCGESPSYGKDFWGTRIPIDSKSYVNGLRECGTTLEPQGKNSVESLYTRLRPRKKNVLVLLQSVTDTTTNHFCGPLENYDSFLSIVKELQQTNEYNVLVKDHPLNTIKLLPDTGIDVSSYNIFDLYDVSDIVLTLNSGGGLIALGDRIPVICMGESFYAQDGLAMKAENLADVRRLIESPLYSNDSVDRFFGYLINNFYSFAQWKYDKRKYSSKTNMSLMRDIQYRKVVIGRTEKTISRVPMNRHSLILETFALDIYQKGKKSELPSVKNASSSKELLISFDGAIKEGYKAFRERRFVSSAAAFNYAARHGKMNAKLLRATAEAYDNAGETSTAIDFLKKANTLAGDHKPIKRRIREMSRSKMVRVLLKGFEKPYPVK